jgi:pimeloyl-ACP methyl ester carboxylesterase
MRSAQDRFVHLNGLRLHFRDWLGPTPDAPLLLLLHGGGNDAQMWDLFAPIFASRYRVVAPDARGHGQSDWSRERQYTTEFQAADITGLLAALGCEDASIVGSSLGGWTGYHVAAEFPHLVTRLVVVDVSPDVVTASARGLIRASGANQNRYASFVVGPPFQRRQISRRHRIREPVPRWSYDTIVANDDSRSKNTLCARSDSRTSRSWFDTQFGTITIGCGPPLRTLNASLASPLIT